MEHSTRRSCSGIAITVGVVRLSQGLTPLFHSAAVSISFFVVFAFLVLLVEQMIHSHRFYASYQRTVDVR